MDQSRRLPARVVLFSSTILLLAGCIGSPRLELESDQSYRRSVAEMRESLDSDEEREFLAHMLKSVRSWRTEEHEELMDVPTLSLAQKATLDELELEHQVHLYELLHDSDLDGVAGAYREFSLSMADHFLAYQQDTLENTRRIVAIEPSLHRLGEFRRAFGTTFSRELSGEVDNRSDSSLTDWINITCVPAIEPSCEGRDCDSKGPTLEIILDLRGKRLDAGATLAFDETQWVEKEELDQQLTGVEVARIDCRASSVRLTPPGAQPLDKPKFVMLLDEPGVALAREEQSIESARTYTKNLRAMPISFEALFEAWKKEKTSGSGG